MEEQATEERRSTSIGLLATALATAQANILGAAKDATNPHFKSKYADLASVWEACRKPLADQGLAVLQPVSSDGGAKVTITTILAHKSGEWISRDLTLTAQVSTPQGIGSAITYGRRYGLAAMVGVAPEDDDGEAAAGRGRGRQSRRQQGTDDDDTEPDGAETPEQEGKRLFLEAVALSSKTDVVFYMKQQFGDDLTAAETQPKIDALKAYLRGLKLEEAIGPPPDDDLIPPELQSALRDAYGPSRQREAGEKLKEIEQIAKAMVSAGTVSDGALAAGMMVSTAINAVRNTINGGDLMTGKDVMDATKIIRSYGDPSGAVGKIANGDELLAGAVGPIPAKPETVAPEAKKRPVAIMWNDGSGEKPVYPRSPLADLPKTETPEQHLEANSKKTQLAALRKEKKAIEDTSTVAPHWPFADYSEDDVLSQIAEFNVDKKRFQDQILLLETMIDQDKTGPHTLTDLATVRRRLSEVQKRIDDLQVPLDSYRAEKQAGLERTKRYTWLVDECKKLANELKVANG